jgi:hypothetical protein
MNCISPIELPDYELLAYLEGEASQEVSDHLESCSYCRQRLDALAGEEALLISRLFRSQCPTPLALGEYQLENIPQEERVVIARHIRVCPHCRAEIRQLETYLRDLSLVSDAPEAQPLDHFRVLVARLVGGGEPGTIAPAWAGVRGPDAGPRMYQAEDFQIAIETQDDPQDQAGRALLGLILGPATTEMQAQLWQGEEHISSAAVEAGGNFVFSGVKLGRYELRVSGPNVMISIQDLDVM